MFSKSSIQRLREQWTSVEETELELQCRDDDAFLLSWSPRTAGEYAWVIESAGVNVSPLDDVVTVSPSSIHPPASVLYGYGARYAIAGITSYLTLQVSDAEGNAILQGGAQLTVVFEDEEDTPITVTDLKDGRYLISYILTKAGVTKGFIQIDWQPERVPFVVTVSTSLSCGQQFRVSSDASALGSAGAVETFAVQAHDAFGNQRRFGGDGLDAALVQASSLVETPCRVTDHGDGSYTVEYTAKCAGDYRLICRRVEAEGQNGVTFYEGLCRIYPGPPCAEACRVWGDGLTGAAPRCLASVFVKIADSCSNVRSLEPLPTETEPANASLAVQGVAQVGAELRTRDYVLSASLLRVAGGESIEGGSVTIHSVAHEDGVYRVAYRASTQGRHHLHLHLDATPLHSSPFTLSIQQSTPQPVRDATFQCIEVRDHLDIQLAQKAQSTN